MTKELMTRQRAALDRLIAAQEGHESQGGKAETSAEVILKLSHLEAMNVWSARVTLAKAELDELRMQEDLAEGDA